MKRFALLAATILALGAGLPNPHLITYIGDDTGSVQSPQNAAPYINFIRTGAGVAETTLWTGLGVSVLPYTDINHYIPGNSAGTNPYLSMSAVAKTCSGAYVLWAKKGETIYLTDPRIPATVLAWEAWWLHFRASGGQAWGVYEDTSDNPFTYASPGPPCNLKGTGPVAQVDWTAATEAQEAAMQSFTGKPIIFNGLGVYAPRLPAQNDLLDGPVAGGLAENCAPKNSTEWLDQLVIEIHAVRTAKYFVCHGNDSVTDGGSSAGIAWRQWQFATMMLDYDLAHTAYVSTLAVGASNLRVQPESGVVPEQPAKVNILSPSDLLKGTGVYGRTYKACYVNGTLVGKCGVLVNSNGSSVAYPWASLHYKHTLAMQGSGVLDGGTVNANGPAPAATMAAYSGEVVFP